MENGQDVLVYAPRPTASRRSCSALRSGRSAGDPRRLLRPHADADEKSFAAALAKTIYSDLETAAGQAIERATRLFRGLRITPTMEVDPTTAAFGSLPRRQAARGGRRHDRGAARTPGRSPPSASGAPCSSSTSSRRSSRSTAPTPTWCGGLPGAAGVGHVYLGSKRHVLERIFEDENEPFWRSAKRLEIGPIEPASSPASSASASRRPRRASTTRHWTGCSRRPAATRTGRRARLLRLGARSRGHFARLRDVETALAQALRSSTTTSPSSGTTRRTRSASSCSRSPRSPRLALRRGVRGAARRRSPLSSGPSGHCVCQGGRRAGRGTRLSDRRAVLRGLAPERAGGLGLRSELRPLRRLPAGRGIGVDASPRRPEHRASRSGRRRGRGCPGRGRGRRGTGSSVPVSASRKLTCAEPAVNVRSAVGRSIASLRRSGSWSRVSGAIRVTATSSCGSGSGSTRPVAAEGRAAPARSRLPNRYMRAERSGPMNGTVSSST